MSTITGTDASETLNGTFYFDAYEDEKDKSGEDTIYGGGGDDLIYGDEKNSDTASTRTADDIIDGGEGDDTVYGDWSNSDYYGNYDSDSDDLIFGNAGNDTLYGGIDTWKNGEDWLFGDLSYDTYQSTSFQALLGELSWWVGEDLYFSVDAWLDLETFESTTDGDDLLYNGTYLFGGGGNDSIQLDHITIAAWGGSGDDYIYDDNSTGQEIVFGGSGNDTIFTGGDQDWMSGDTGNDYLNGGSGSDTILGGSGQDVLIPGDQAEGDLDEMWGEEDGDLFFLSGIETTLSDTTYGLEQFWSYYGSYYAANIPLSFITMAAELSTVAGWWAGLANTVISVAVNYSTVIAYQLDNRSVVGAASNDVIEIMDFDPREDVIIIQVTDALTATTGWDDDAHSILTIMQDGDVIAKIHLSDEVKSLLGSAYTAEDLFYDVMANTRAEYDGSALTSGFLSNRSVIAVFDAPWGLMFVGVLWLLDPWLGIFCLLSIVLLTGLAVVGEVLTGPLQRNSNAKQISLQRWCEAAIEQAESIVALGMRGAVLEWYGTECVPARQAADTAAGRLEIVIALSRTFRQITQVAIIGFSAWLAIESSLTAGGVIASSILLGRALAPFDQLIAGWRQLVAARDARRRLSELLRQPDSHIERSSLPPPVGELSVHRLTVRSPAGNNRWLLQDVSFRAQPGRGVGIIGPSGAGKTTLCRAATGLVAPDIGEIRLDGARLDMWESDELGRHLGYLQQDVGLPPATVAQTIARLQRNADPELIHAAARAAGAHELILGLPYGYDTPVGAGGVPISGGQRQRIGLARALYGNPVLIILDEPDAHLDHAGEEALRSAIINAKQRGAAVVLVAQRPAMIALMDDVVVLQNGKVTQFGPRVDVLRTAMRKEQTP